VFYRRIWNIVGKYSILCCDNSRVTARDSMGRKLQQIHIKPGRDVDQALEGKNTWDSAVRTFVPRMLDMSIH
jgi:hypothetical protein